MLIVFAKFLTFDVLYVFSEAATRGALYKKIFCSFIKGALSGLRQFSATKSPLKMMKNAFCFTLDSFVHIEKRLN